MNQACYKKIFGEDYMISITRHENRKLYVPAVHRYTNFEEIKALVKNGERVMVVDHNGTDVTAEVLSKVLTLTKNVSISELSRLIRDGN